MAKFFIHRPVFAIVIAIIISLIGIIAGLNTPIAQYPIFLSRQSMSLQIIPA